MGALPVTSSLRKGYIIIAIAVLVSCLLLFSIDKDTHSCSDLMNPGNLVALVLYFTPTFGICALLFSVFKKRLGSAKSLFNALCIGIPVGIAIVIVLLVSLR